MDLERGLSRQRSRIEVLEGARAGDVIEEIHDMNCAGPGLRHPGGEERQPPACEAHSNRRLALARACLPADVNGQTRSV